MFLINCISPKGCAAISCFHDFYCSYVSACMDRILSNVMIKRLWYELFLIRFWSELMNKEVLCWVCFMISVIAVCQPLQGRILPNYMHNTLIMKKCIHSIFVLISQNGSRLSYAWGKFYSRIPNQLLYIRESRFTDWYSHCCNSHTLTTTLLS